MKLVQTKEKTTFIFVEDNNEISHKLIVNTNIEGIPESEILDKFNILLEAINTNRPFKKLLFKILDRHDLSVEIGIFDDLNAAASYNDYLKRIRISILHGNDHFDMLSHFIFECINSDNQELHKVEISDFDTAEEYAIASEKAESKNFERFNEIISYGLDNLNWPEEMRKELFIIDENTLDKLINERTLNYKGYTHADTYRLAYLSEMTNKLQSELNIYKSFSSSMIDEKILKDMMNEQEKSIKDLEEQKKIIDKKAYDWRIQEGRIFFQKELSDTVLAETSENFQEIFINHCWNLYFSDGIKKVEEYVNDTIKKIESLKPRRILTIPRGVFEERNELFFTQRNYSSISTASFNLNSRNDLGITSAIRHFVSNHRDDLRIHESLSRALPNDLYLNLCKELSSLIKFDNNGSVSSLVLSSDINLVKLFNAFTNVLESNDANLYKRMIDNLSEIIEKGKTKLLTDGKTAAQKPDSLFHTFSYYPPSGNYLSVSGGNKDKIYEMVLPMILTELKDSYLKLLSTDKDLLVGFKL